MKKVKVKVTQKRTLEFVSLTGDVFMTLEDVTKDIKWSSILEKIAIEDWYLTCEKWRFVFGIKNLESNDVLESDSDVIKITCIKIVPQILFETQTGELLVSVPFQNCRSLFDRQVYLISACFEAHKKLEELDKDGYGIGKTKIHALIKTYIDSGCEIPCSHYREYPYVYHDKNGKLLDLYDILEDPGDDNLIIVAHPKEVYCYHVCDINFHGSLRNGQRRRDICEKITLCSNCGFLHCPSCGMYQYYKVGTSECRRYHTL